MSKELQFRKFKINESFLGVQWNFQKPWTAKGRNAFYREDFRALTGKTVEEMSMDGQSRGSLVVTKTKDQAMAIFNLAIKDGAKAVLILNISTIKRFPEGESDSDLKLLK